MNSRVFIGLLGVELSNHVLEVLAEFIEFEFVTRFVLDEVFLRRLVESPQPRRYLANPAVHVPWTTEQCIEAFELALDPRDRCRSIQHGGVVPAVIVSAPLIAN